MILIGILFFCILLYIFYPLFEKYDNDVIIESDNQSNRYKNILLKQIKDLEFDKEMGIITEEDYNLIKSSLLIEMSKYIEK